MRTTIFVARDFIPPQLFDRYMAVVNRATELRALDKNLKTQVRWGTKDVEIFSKIKGSQEPLKRTNLSDFMDGNKLPSFDLNIHWKARANIRSRRKLEFGHQKSDLPSLQQNQNTDKINSGGIVRTT